MSNIVEPQITETKSTSLFDKFNNLPAPIQKPVFQQDKGEPYVFLKDFSFINSTTDGSFGSNMVNYKKDQVVYPFPSSPNVRMMPNPAFTKAINEGVLVPQKTAQQQALQQAQQQAMLQEVSKMTEYSGLTDKVFGKQEGWSFERPMRLGAYIIVGAVVGRYVAKNMGKSTTLGMVVGGLAPLLAYQLTLEYDKKKALKQEPKQKVALISDKEKIALFEKAINSWKGGVAPPREWEENNRKEVDLANAKIKELKLETEFSTWLSNRPKVDYGMYPPPTMPNKPKTSFFDNSKYPIECMMKYALQAQPAVVMPPEYWKKREEDWMKTNCK